MFSGFCSMQISILFVLWSASSQERMNGRRREASDKDSGMQGGFRLISPHLFFAPSIIKKFLERKRRCMGYRYLLLMQCT